MHGLQSHARTSSGSTSTAGAANIGRCVTADREQLIEIFHDPDVYYVHALDFPTGAVCGQFSK